MNKDQCCNHDCNQGRKCPVREGTHKPAEAVHQIQEPSEEAQEAWRAGIHAGRDQVLQAAPAEVVMRQLEPKPAFYTAIAVHDGEWIPLPEYSSQTSDGVLGRVLERARAEGYQGGNALERLKELGWAYRPVYFAVDPEQVAPLPLLVRDIAREIGITGLEACAALKPMGNFSVNMAVTAEMAAKLRDCFPEPMAAPAAVAVPDERAAFESWADSRKEDSIYLPKFADGTYINDDTHAAWEAWQARAALAATPAAAPVIPSELIEAVDAWFAQNTGLGGCSDKDVAELAAIFAAAAPVTLPEPVPTPCRSMFATQREYADAMVQHRKNWAEIEAERALLATGGQAQAVEQEPFGYFKAEPFGWTDCGPDDEGAVALYERPQAQADARDAEQERWMGIGKAIERACVDLPAGAEINIHLEKDAGTVTLSDCDGDEQENFPTDEGFAGVVNAAIDAAIAAAKGE